MMFSSGKKQKKRQAELMASLEKGKQVVTIGGIRGVIHSVADDEVVIKVDESSNTKLRFDKTSIRTVG